MDIASLASGAINFLFNLFIPGFDFPTSAVKFNHLLDGKREVGAEKCDPSALKWGQLRRNTWVV